MKEVKAVKDLDVVKMIPKLLVTHHSQQFSDIWTLGVNTALRISDLLSIKYTDIKGDRLTIKESKTGKCADIHLNQTALATITNIRDSAPDAIFLFQATARNVKTIKPLSRQAVGQAFKEIGDIVNINLSTHSMRKTRGYHMYKKFNDIGEVMKMLRHSSTAVTLRYIGIDQEQIDKGFANLEL
ncbi:MAG: tyrosine-type recombinase/integrase [Colwellia sp.]|nr:tyrosine-type recombinase/integrase [Colwellia sp.]